MARTIRGKNEGSLTRQPNGKWRAMVTLNGKRLSKVYKTKAECQAWIKNLLGEIDQGLSYKGTRTLLKEYFEDWLRTVKQNRRAKTHLGYRRIADRYILPHMGDWQLREVKPLRVEQYLTTLQEQGIGDRTCQLIYAALHVCLNSALRKGIIGRNPMAAVDKPKVKHPRRIVVLQPEQIQQFLIAADGHPHEALYHLAITAGMREGEILGLKWSDLDWDRGWIRVQRQVQRIDGVGLVFAEPKTQFGNRVLALGPVTLERLKAHRERQKVDMAVAGNRWKDLDLVFPTVIGSPLDPHNLLKEFKGLLEKAGLPRMRFHDLRHTSVTLVLNEIGAPVKEAQHRAGHASPSTTINIYAGMATTRTDEMVARSLDDLITPVKLQLHTTAHDGKSLPVRKA